MGNDKIWTGAVQYCTVHYKWAGIVSLVHLAISVRSVSTNENRFQDGKNDHDCGGLSVGHAKFLHQLICI